MSSSPSHHRLLSLPLTPPAPLLQRLLSESPQRSRPQEETGKKLGTMFGVFIPTCENMWGAVVFLRFGILVGKHGVGECLWSVGMGGGIALATTACLVALASSGGPVSEGGTYFMISRSLGGSVGASIGLVYWLGVVLLGVMESLGASEIILGTDCTWKYLPAGTAALLIGVLSFLVGRGSEEISRFGAIFGVAACFSVIVLLGGLGSGGFGEISGKTWKFLVYPSFSRLEENWESDGKSSGSSLVIISTCFAGIFSGADRADSLFDSPRSIKIGTYGAVIFSTFLYFVIFVLWGASSDRRWLLGEEGGQLLAGVVGGGESYKWSALMLGVFSTCVAQVMQCLVVGSRLIFEISKNGKFPGFPQDTEKFGLVLTCLLGICFCIIGSLDKAAPLVSVCFFIAYAFVSASCFIQVLLQPPTWRPESNSLFLGSAAALSFLGCVWLIKEVGGLWGTGVGVLVFFITCLSGNEPEWGHGLDGMKISLGLAILGGLEENSINREVWRPHILVATDVTPEKNLEISSPLISLQRIVSQLKRGKGVTFVLAVLRAGDKDAVRIEISRFFAEKGLGGCAQSVCARSVGAILPLALDLMSFGNLRPNTVLMCWPSENGVDFVKGIAFALQEGKALLSWRGETLWPCDIQRGKIDIWWFIHDGGLLLCLTWLLTQNNIWDRCKVRIFAVVAGHGGAAEDRELENNLKCLLERSRVLLGAEILTVRLEDISMLEPYTGFVSPFGFSPVAAEPVGLPSQSSAASPRWLSCHTEAILDHLHDRMKGKVVSSEVSPSRKSGIPPTAATYQMLNRIVRAKSAESALVLMNLPHVWGVEEEDCLAWLAYCECLTMGIQRVLFVHSAGHEGSRFF